MSNTKINSWDWDIRVRERNLKHGILNEKDVEKQKAQLPDLTDQSEAATLPQPAIGPVAGIGRFSKRFTRRACGFRNSAA